MSSAAAASTTSLPPTLLASKALIKYLSGQVESIKPTLQKQQQKEKIRTVIESVLKELGQKISNVYHNHKTSFSSIEERFKTIKATTYKDGKAYQAEWTKLSDSVEGLKSIISKATGKSPENSPPTPSYMPPQKVSPKVPTKSLGQPSTPPEDVRKERSSSQSISPPQSRQHSPRDKEDLQASVAAFALLPATTALSKNLSNEMIQKSFHEPVKAQGSSAAGLSSIPNGAQAQVPDQVFVTYKLKIEQLSLEVVNLKNQVSLMKDKTQRNSLYEQFAALSAFLAKQMMDELDSEKIT